MTPQSPIVKQTKISKAGLAEQFLYLDGHKYSLFKYQMFVSIYNSTYPRLIMRAGRQVSKTTMLAGDMVMSVVCQPNTPTLYCNSSAEQTASFSRSKLDPFLKQSPGIYNYLFSGKDIIDNVYHKQFYNHSEIMMSYFSDSADRVRGRTAHILYLDEVQDMLYDAMIDAEECLSAAEHPRTIYAGTSKSLITPLEYIWSESTQNCWLLPCSHCGVKNVPSIANIGKHGLICKKCGGSLNTYDGFWYSFNQPKDGKRPYADGYWIPQIIMPIHCTVQDKWDRLLEKMELYPEVKFNNEVMGLPSGDGEQPFTEDDLRAMCREDMEMTYERTLKFSSGAEFLAAGIDWGGGGAKNVSRTVLSIYAVYPGEHPKYRLLFGKIYTEGEPAKHLGDIAQHLRRFAVNIVCADHGLGSMAISGLKQALNGISEGLSSIIPIYPVMYSDARSPFKLNNDGQYYVVNRTTMIDDFFMDIKRKFVEVYRWSEFEPFARDILNVRQAVVGEDSGHPRRVWRHNPKDPDDALHSMVFGWFAARVRSGRMDFTGATT